MPPSELVFLAAPVARLSIFSFLLVSRQNLPFSWPKNPYPSAQYLLLLVPTGIYLCRISSPSADSGLCTCLTENSPGKGQGRHLTPGTHIPAVCTAVFVVLSAEKGGWEDTCFRKLFMVQLEEFH